MSRYLSENNTGAELYEKAKTLIPGGTQLLTKRPEMFLPDNWPSYYSRAQGTDVWDLDGNRYVDMSYNGVGACILGHADPDVNAAVHVAVDAGSMATLNCPQEVELAELLCELHPWADMVRYTRSGGEAMSVAVRIARAASGRDKVAFCGYHGWHDWYLAANLSGDGELKDYLLPGLSPNGVPKGLRGTALPFHYNRLEELQDIILAHPDEVGVIVMEPLRSEEPVPGFLEGVRRLADEAGAVLVIDEITMGFRLTQGGAHLMYDLEPDIAVFGKAMSNGFPMAAVIGRKTVMQAAQSTFISSTYWTERIGPAAALATIGKIRREDVPAHLEAIGAKVKDGWEAAAQAANLDIHVSGVPALAHFEFQDAGRQAVRTLYTQMMLERGYLATGSFYATFAHQDSHVEKFLDNVGEVFHRLARAVDADEIEALLQGPVAHTGFQRLA